MDVRGKAQRWNQTLIACVQVAMGTLTIPMVHWTGMQHTLQSGVREQQQIWPNVLRNQRVQRDDRGTLQPPFNEAAVQSYTRESSGFDSAQAEQEAPPAQGLIKSAETDALHLLVFSCMRGDAAAWQQLVSSQHRRIYGMCYRFTGSPTDAEDLTQDVFLKVYRNLQGFDPAKGAFTTWLTSVTRNLLVDHFRRTRQERSTDSLDAPAQEDGEGPTMAERLADTRPGQMQRLAQMELRARVQHALKHLSPELREAVILRDLQDMDYKEIATVLRVPEGTVKSRISRGRGELARALGRAEGRVV